MGEREVRKARWGYLKALNELEELLWTRKRVRVGLEGPKEGPLFQVSALIDEK